MSGVKGRSGRKPLRDEIVQANVIDMAWATVSRALNSARLTAREKLNIAIEIVKKTCPNESLTPKTLVVIYGHRLKSNDSTVRLGQGGESESSESNTVESVGVGR